MSKLKKFTIAALLAAVSTAGTLIVIREGLFAIGHKIALSLFFLPSICVISLIKITHGSPGLPIDDVVLFVQFLLIYWPAIAFVSFARRRPKMAIISISIMLVLLGGVYGISRYQITKNNNLPVEVSKALSAPDMVTLYSLEPWGRPAVGEEALHEYKVLGHTDLDKNQSAIAIREFRSALSGWDGIIASCFDPRHAIRVTAGNHIYDLLLCYACHQLYVYEGDKLIASLGAAGSSKILNGVLTGAKVPLSTTDTDEDRLAKQKRSDDSEARWVAAMPKSIRLLGMIVTWDQITPDIKPLRGALAGQFPDNHQRILALFAWYGSGDGPWSGFPSYESVAEELLLDFPTPELIAAARTDTLTDAQIEGAARLFGGWDFGHRRPNDVSSIPADLKKKLLEHTLKSTDEDKLNRAKKAFGQP
jgi:hypothetical protein